MVGDSISGSPGSPPVALTASQWLQLDVYGFVLIDDVLTDEEIRRMKDALYRLKSEPDLDALGVYVNRRNDHLFHVGHVLEYDPALLEYAAHPRLTALAGEVVGGKVRVEETEAIINSRDPAMGPGVERLPKAVPTGFHTGARDGWGTYYENHHFHCLFVKTLAYLTDVAPTDGGTAVIPGSHRLSVPEPEIIAAALADERLVHQVEAKAGSVLLFPESLVHSTTDGPRRTRACRADHGVYSADDAQFGPATSRAPVRGVTTGRGGCFGYWSRQLGVAPRHLGVADKWGQMPTCPSQRLITEASPPSFTIILYRSYPPSRGGCQGYRPQRPSLEPRMADHTREAGATTEQSC